MKNVMLALGLMPVISIAQTISGSTDPHSFESVDDLPWEIQFNKDFDNNGFQETTGTILLQQFNTAGGSISFDYTFLTSEYFGDSGAIELFNEESPFIHDLFRVGLWEIDTAGERTGEFISLHGGAATAISDEIDPYTGDFDSVYFGGKETFPGQWGLHHTSTTEELEFYSNVFFSEGAAEGSFSGSIPAGNWELEFLVAHSYDYSVASGLAIDNVFADGLINGDFENGLEGWFYIGWAGVLSNRHGSNPKLVDYNLFSDTSTFNPDQAFLPAPGTSFNFTSPNDYVLIGAPDLYLIPEPSTYILSTIGICICAIWFLRRRKA